MVTHLCQVDRVSRVNATTTPTPRLRATVTESLGGATAVSMTQRASAVSAASQVTMAMLWRETVQVQIVRVSTKELQQCRLPRFPLCFTSVLPRHSIFLKLGRNTGGTVLFLLEFISVLLAKNSTVYKI